VLKREKNIVVNSLNFFLSIKKKIVSWANK